MISRDKVLIYLKEKQDSDGGYTGNDLTELVTEAEVLKARRLIRSFPQSPLIRFDSERPVILRKFIKLIGDELEDISDLDIEGWLKSFKTEALLMP